MAKKLVPALVGALIALFCVLVYSMHAFSVTKDDSGIFLSPMLMAVVFVIFLAIVVPLHLREKQNRKGNQPKAVRRKHAEVFADIPLINWVKRRCAWNRPL